MKHAFPVRGPAGLAADYGMTLRDYFAAAALHGLVNNWAKEGLTVEEIAEFAYDVAGAMMKEREQR